MRQLRVVLLLCFDIWQSRCEKDHAETDGAGSGMTMCQTSEAYITACCSHLQKEISSVLSTYACCMEGVGTPDGSIFLGMLCTQTVKHYA